jgi:hypothetical protein
MQVQKASPSSTVFTPLADGTAVLLNLDTLAYYSLNRTGALVWQQIEEKTAVSLDELVRLVCERFEISPDRSRSTLIPFLDQLAGLNMVRVS